jgi:hypothetical protein
MKIKCLYIILAFNIFSNIAYAQLGINSSNSEPNSRAMLDVESTTKGVLIPRLSTGQRNAINTPPAGLMIYNATDNKYNYFNGANWSEFVVGGFTLPYFISIDINGAAFQINNNNTSSFSSAIQAVSLYGKGMKGFSEYNVGVDGGSYNGIGVYGHADDDLSSTSNTYVGVKGQSYNANGVGVQAFGTTGLEVNGAIKVSGQKFVFIHTATVSNKISANGTDITNSMCNGDPNALLIVSQKINYAGTVYNNSPIGTYYNYDRGKWEIRNQNGTPIPINAQFTVMVVKQ